MFIRMFPRTIGTFLTVAISLSHGLTAAEVTGDVAPLDAKTLESQLESFAATRDKQKKAFYENARTQLNKTALQSGSAGNFVLGCMRQVRFGNVKGGNAEGADWKKNNIKLYSDRDIERAAALNLRYLAMTLKRAEWDSSEPVQQETWDYLAELYKSPDLVADVKKDPRQVKFSVYDEKEGKVVSEMVGNMQGTEARMPDNPRGYVEQLLNNSVASGWVAQVMELSGHLDNLDSWEMSPGNFSGILDKDIRAFLRKKKDPRLISTWDYEISFLSLVANMNPDRKVQAKFAEVDKPRLLWKQATDANLVGMPNRALQMQLALAKNYPAHPDFESWTKEILAKLDALKKAAPDAEKVDQKAAAITPVTPVN